MSGKDKNCRARIDALHIGWQEQDGGRNQKAGKPGNKSRTGVYIRANELFGLLEQKGKGSAWGRRGKAGERRVRTAAGSKKYGLPIGAVISRDVFNPANVEVTMSPDRPVEVGGGKDKPPKPNASFTSPVQKTGKFNGLSDNVLTQDDIATPTKKEIRDFDNHLLDRSNFYIDITDSVMKKSNAPGNEDNDKDLLPIGPQESARIFHRPRHVPNPNYKPGHPKEGPRYVLADTYRVDYALHLGKKGASDKTPVYHQVSVYADSHEKAVDILKALSSRTYKRLKEPGDDYDEQGFWPANRTKRPVPPILENYEGIRGVDWFYPDDEHLLSGPRTNERRMALARKEGDELGFKWGGYTPLDRTKYRPEIRGDDLKNPTAPWAMEATNAVLRSMEAKYPGFVGLHSNILSSDGGSRNDPAAWSNIGRSAARDPETGEILLGDRTFLGMNPKYFGIKASSQNKTLVSMDEDPGTLIPHSPVQTGQVAMMLGLDRYQAAAAKVMTHEVGHTVGYIVTGTLRRNGRSHESYVPGNASPATRLKITEDAARKWSRERRTPDATVSSTFRDEALDLLMEFGILKEDRPRSDNDNPIKVVGGGDKPIGTEVDIEHIDIGGYTGALKNRSLSEDHFNRAAIAQQLSTYGATNMQELFAETWCAYQLDNNPTEFVLRMGELMEEALRMFLSEEDGSREQFKTMDEGVETK